MVKVQRRDPPGQMLADDLMTWIIDMARMRGLGPGHILEAIGFAMIGAMLRIEDEKARVEGTRLFWGIIPLTTLIDLIH